MKVQVLVRLKPGVLDVQGKAIERGLSENGYTGFSDVRIGKLIEFETKSSDLSEAQEEIEKACRELLANPIIENYEIRAAA